MKLAVALQRISNEYKQGIHLESSIRNNEASRSPPMNLYKYNNISKQYIFLIVQCYINTLIILIVLIITQTFTYIK